MYALSVRQHWCIQKDALNVLVVDTASVAKCIKKCKREGDICMGCLRTMDEIREEGMKQLELPFDETFEQRVYRIGSELFGNDPGMNFEEYSQDPTFMQIVELVKRVMEDVEASNPRIALL